MTRLAPLAFLLAASCTTHAIAIGGYSMNFHGGQLNAPPIKVDRLRVAGTDLVFRHSTFIYMMDGPFQTWQLAMSVDVADPAIAWTPTLAERQEFAIGWMQSAQQRLDMSKPGQPRPAQCAAPSQDGDAWQFECQVEADGRTAHLRARVLPAQRGLLAQEVTWSSDKGKEFSDAFWASLHPVAPSAPRPSGLVIPIAAVVALASEVAMR